MIALQIIIFIVAYLVIFFLIRKGFQLHYKKGYEFAINCQMDWTWWIPIGNIITLLMVYSYLAYNMYFVDPNNRAVKKARKWGNPTWLWLTNQHLKG